MDRHARRRCLLSIHGFHGLITFPHSLDPYFSCKAAGEGHTNRLETTWRFMKGFIDTNAPTLHSLSRPAVMY